VVVDPYSATATFGAEGAPVALSQQGEFDAFVAAWAPDGTLLFAASSGGTSSDSAQGVTVVDGAAWVTGWFGGDATFDVVGTSATGSSGFYLLRRPL
jgi:hypothetical protein